MLFEFALTKEGVETAVNNEIPSNGATTLICMTPIKRFLDRNKPQMFQGFLEYSDFSTLGELADRKMVWLFSWHCQHKSAISRIRMTEGKEFSTSDRMWHKQQRVHHHIHS